MNELIISAIGLAATITSGWTSWFFTRKKYSTEVDNNYIDNIEKGLETYDSIIQHNKAEIEYLLRENEELRKELAELRKQVFNLTMNICLDLTCSRRLREQREIKIRDGKSKDRFSETEGPGIGGHKSSKPQ